MSSIDNRLLTNMVQLVKSRTPEGIKIMDILLEYKIRYGVYPNVVEMGFNTLYSFCQYVCQHSHSSLVIIERDDYFTTERIFFDELHYINWINELKINRNFSILELLVSFTLPEDIVYQGLCQPLPKLKLPDNTFNSEFIKYNLGIDLIFKFDSILI
jgi:hypothetical protein